jgi:hypothetical protein
MNDALIKIDSILALEDIAKIKKRFNNRKIVSQNVFTLSLNSSLK